MTNTLTLRSSLAARHVRFIILSLSDLADSLHYLADRDTSVDTFYIEWRSSPLRRPHDELTSVAAFDSNFTVGLRRV